MLVKYELTQDIINKYGQFIEEIISTRGINSVLEVGGGANPTITLDYVKGMGIEYTVLDVSGEELLKVPQEYNKIKADITALEPNQIVKVDLVFSRLVAEHVHSGYLFHKNIFELLSAGGIAVHLFPTLYALPYVVNRIIPEPISYQLVKKFQKRRDLEKQGKFPAYYDWCKGPTQNQIRKFEDIGYSVEQYIGFFGHSGYYERVRPLKAINNRISKILVNYPIPWFTSFALLVLSK